MGSFSKIQKTMVQRMEKALSCVSVISGWLISGKGVSEDASDVFPDGFNSQNPEDSSVQLWFYRSSLRNACLVIDKGRGQSREDCL